LDVVFCRRHNAGRRKNIIWRVKDLHGKAFINAGRNILDQVFAGIVRLCRKCLALASTDKLRKLLAEFDRALIAAFAKADFDRTVKLIDAFTRREMRISLKMQLAETGLN
ncbi:MAG: hypothetical protein AB7J13_10965, partial [Pyrinomonadaceae bacterium]